MTRSLLRTVLALLIAATWLASAIPAAAAAREMPAGSCHAYSADTIPLAEAGHLAWTCRDSDWRDGRAVTWLRFPFDRTKTAPTLFSSRITIFEKIEIAALDSGGTMRVRAYTTQDAQPVVNGAVFVLPLPKPHADTTGWLVRIERPHSVTVASEARLGNGALSQDSLIAIISLAVVAGMLIMPLLFDINFYLVLRERFVLLHAVMVVAMICYVMFSGGLLTAFVTPPLPLMAIGGPLMWAIGTGMAGFFLRAFLEPGTLPKAMHTALGAAAWWAMLVPGFSALQFTATQSFDNRLFFLGYLLVIPTYSIAILWALAHGSRAARFMTAAWAPIIIASVDRLLRGMGVYAAPSSLDQAMFLALGIEVIIIALGVADRFLAIRHERDLALSEARSLEELSERDPLTGLLNRRALEDRFLLLRAEGFTTLAVIDLDHFKRVNDTHGHAVGDRVLKAVARVLNQDTDTLAFRMGGEEFLLLLRGRDSVERAEHRRQAISGRIAEEVPGLDRMVTASMGLIEVPASVMPNASFAELYDRADQLLYEAKQAGRNRTMSERLKVFVPRRIDRRKSVA